MKRTSQMWRDKMWIFSFFLSSFTACRHVHTKETRCDENDDDEEEEKTSRISMARKKTKKQQLEKARSELTKNEFRFSPILEQIIRSEKKKNNRKKRDFSFFFAANNVLPRMMFLKNIDFSLQLGSQK